MYGLYELHTAMSTYLNQMAHQDSGKAYPLRLGYLAAPSLHNKRYRWESGAREKTSTGFSRNQFLVSPACTAYIFASLFRLSCVLCPPFSMRFFFSHSLQFDEKPSLRLLLRPKNSGSRGSARPHVKHFLHFSGGVSISNLCFFAVVAIFSGISRVIMLLTWPSLYFKPNFSCSPANISGYWIFCRRAFNTYCRTGDSSAISI